MGITLLVVVSLGHSRELGFKWLALRPVFPEVRKLRGGPHTVAPYRIWCRGRCEGPNRPRTGGSRPGAF